MPREKEDQIKKLNLAKTVIHLSAIQLNCLQREEAKQEKHTCTAASQESIALRATLHHLN